jgi:hypothetical protein
VTTQPDSSETIETTPLTATARRNHLPGSAARDRRQSHANHRASPSRAKPVPTMTSKDRWTMETRWSGGRTAAGMASSPLTSVPGLKPDKSDAPSGIGIP